MTVLFSRPADPVDPGLLSRALEVGGRLANDAAEVIAATAARGYRVGEHVVRSGESRPGTVTSGKATHFDWVTDTDRTLERHTRRVLLSEFPDIPVFGAQYAAELPSSSPDEPPDGSGARYRWLVAPVDGTVNYLAGLPWYGYSLALVDGAGPVVGVISDPSRAEIYAAARGRGTRVNGVPVRIPERVSAIGYPVCTELGPDGGWPGMDRFLALAARAHCGVRILGSAALALAQVAMGHAVAAVLPEYRPWDVAAGLALALEAGAVVLDRHGRPDPAPRDGVLVAAPAAAEDVLAWWRLARTESRPDEH
jgi:myo-inositol-1(or 4)-monophosphatase